MNDIKDYSKYLKYYPNKSLAIRDYRLDTGVSLREGKQVIDEIFACYESTGEKMQKEPQCVREHQERIDEKKESNYTGLKIGCGLFLLLKLLFGPIVKVTKKYH